MLRSTVSPPERARMRQLRAQGLSAASIAAIVGRSKACVLSQVAGVSYRGQGAGYDVTNREVERMRELRAQGLPLEEVAAIVGRTGPCVAHYTRDLGVRCRNGTKGLGSDGYARLLKLADDGMPHRDLAERFGMTKGSITATVSRLRRQRREAAQEARAC